MLLLHTIFCVHVTDNMRGGVQTQASSECLHFYSLKASPRPTGIQKKRKQTRTGEGLGTNWCRRRTWNTWNASGKWCTLSPARLLWHILKQYRPLAVGACISLRATSPTANMLGKLRGDSRERKKSALIILLQKLQEACGKWAQFFLPSDLYQSHCSPWWSSIYHQNEPCTSGIPCSPPTPAQSFIEKWMLMRRTSTFSKESNYLQ